MALYSTETKKGHVTDGLGKPNFIQGKCHPSVDEKLRMFTISIIDKETGKDVRINLYGEEVIELHKTLNHYMASQKL